MEDRIEQTTPKRPRISVGAIVRHFGGVLLVKCIDQSGAAALWQLPRAEQQWGEPLPQTVERAVQLQTGIRVAAGDIFQVYDLIAMDADDHTVMLDFEAAYLDGDLSPGDHVEDVAWASGLALRSMEVEENTAELLSDMGIL